jgi:hypothetical protein
MVSGNLKGPNERPQPSPARIETFHPRQQDQDQLKQP